MQFDRYQAHRFDRLFISPGWHTTWNTKPPTTADIKIIIQKFKKSKAPGPDGITTDLVKDLGWEALDAIQKMIKKWWKERKVPDSITLARVVSLYKKGDPEKTRKL